MSWNPTEPGTLDLAVLDVTAEIDDVKREVVKLLTSQTKVLIGIDNIIKYGTRWVVLYRTRTRSQPIISRAVVVGRASDGHLFRYSGMVVSLDHDTI